MNKATRTEITKRDKSRSLLLFLLLVVIGCGSAKAQNPLISCQYSADPSARVFGDRVYLFPSHDILATEGKGRVGWFCMEDYHVFSSANLTDWMDHGVIITQNKVPWVKPNSYSMWAPDCIERGLPIKNVHGIDPNVFIDKDGQAYLNWAQGYIYAAKLKENMLELASEPKILGELPDKGLKEGPFLFERNGVYYLTYPHVGNKTERLEYATADNPLGPFKVAGVIMDESPPGCWTNHQSIIQFKGQWYLFYHHNDYSPGFDKARSVQADSLSCNPDGTIRKVVPTLRGIGVTDAGSRIEIDRYSKISDSGVSVAFIDTADKFKGWAAVFRQPGAWAHYISVDFGEGKFQSINIKAQSKTGALLQVRLNDSEGPVIAEAAIAAGDEWKISKAVIHGLSAGIHNVVVILKNGGGAAVDYLECK